MIIKFDEKSTQAIRAWFRRNGLNCGCGFINGRTFLYDDETGRVAIPRFYIATELDEALKNHLENKGLQTSIDWLTITILHEVGHSETVRFFNLKELKYNMIEKEKISFNLTEENELESNYIYWELPVEDMANKWAINYANTFPEKVKRLEELLHRHAVIIE